MADQIITLLATFGVGGLLGILANNLLTNRRDNAKRRTEFYTRQLEEFYGPLLSLHNEIRAHSDLRVTIQQAIDESHVKAMLSAGPQVVEGVSDANIPIIRKNVQDENETFKQLLMPRYHDMVNTFREKMWLAEPATRVHFPTLVEFVSVWDKILNDRLPREIAPAVGHTEENLRPFYSHLEETHDRLRAQLTT